MEEPGERARPGSRPPGDHREEPAHSGPAGTLLGPEGGLACPIQADLSIQSGTGVERLSELKKAPPQQNLWVLGGPKGRRIPRTPRKETSFRPSTLSLGFDTRKTGAVMRPYPGRERT